MNFSSTFVCEDFSRSTYEQCVGAPLFRKAFTLDGTVKSAQLLICGLGFYDLFINGTKITKGYLAPYISNPNHYTYFDLYDLLPYLTEGENVIGVMLGDGHQNEKTAIWDFVNNTTNSAPLLALSADFECENTHIHFEADDFFCKKGPVVFNDLRSGVFYDARLEEKGWHSPGFIQKDWHKPLIAPTPKGTGKLCTAEPVRVYKEIEPVKIFKGECVPYVCSRQLDDFVATLSPFEEPVPPSGGYIYDFGENIAGIYRLKIKGEKGRKISLQCAEQLTDGKLNCNNINFYPDGFSQRDIYYLSGEGTEIFEPMFTFHGFRYIYVYGITPEEATKDLLTCLPMSSALEKTGDFHCSDETANQIFQMGQRSDLSNFFYFPLDCPHREKNGWTGDAVLSAEHHILTLNTVSSWREWLNNVRAAQTDEGRFPGIVPTDTWGYEWGNGPAWDKVIFELPYCAYRYTGNTQIIEENANAMIKYLKYAQKRRDKRGIAAFGLGDWLPVGKECNEFDADLGFTDSVMLLDMCRKGAVMFDAVNLVQYSEFVKKLGEELLSSIRSAYIDFSTLTVKKESQSAQAMAIFYDVFTQDEKRAAFDVLKSILKKDDYKFTCGCLGIRVLFHVLSDFGESELAYRMITRNEFPSYGYWAAKGETTFLEHFFEYDNYFHESKNHHFLGDVLNWFMRCVGGLCVEDSHTVTVRPHFIKALEHCTVSHRFPSGDISINWQRNEDNISLSVTTHGDITYTLDLENGYSGAQTADGAWLITK